MTAGPREVVLFERPGCHLCDEAALLLEPIVREAGARLTRVNVAADPALEAQYGFAIPVVTVDGVEATRAPIDAGAVRAMLGHGAAPIDRSRGRI